MSRALPWRVLASVVVFVFIIAGQAYLASELFVLWVGALLLAANALQVLIMRYLQIRKPPGSHHAQVQLPYEHSGLAGNIDLPALPAEEEAELNDLQAQLTTLEDQFATELHNSKLA